MLAEGHPVTVEGLPAHLAAFAAVEQLPAADGGLRDRTDRRGQVRYDKVWVRSPGPPPGKVSGSGLAERDLRWLASATSQRRGSRAEGLAGPAGNSAGCSACCTSSTCPRPVPARTTVRHRAPRPDAQPTLDRWLSTLTAQDGELSRRLAAAVPAAAKAWAAEEAPRLITAAADDALTRAALTEDLCALSRRLPADGLPLSACRSRPDRAQHTRPGRHHARPSRSAPGRRHRGPGPASKRRRHAPSLGSGRRVGQTGSPARSPAGTFPCIEPTPRPR